MQDSAPVTDGEAALSLGRMETSIGFLLRLSQISTFAEVYRLDPGNDMSLSERTVLQVIEANPHARQGAIADALRIKWPHMTKLVRGLELRGLVTREVPPADRRSVYLSLTERGEALVAGLGPRMARNDIESLPMLDADERTEMVRLLRKVAGLPPLETKA